MKKKEEKYNTIGRVQAKDLVEEMKESYIDYAMSVIVARALPDVRDGLKPVHRRILYAMYEDGLTHASKFRKSATVVGATLGRYHPHGDAAVYDALVRMAQDFTMRYPLIEGQGNFGSVDGDAAAQMRYTECRLTKIAEEMLKDIEKNTVDFQENYDGTRKEPKVLPALPPNLLLNGSLGIAVGMATSIPPHNLNEVCDAAIYLLDHKDATTEDLFQFIKGPDFPTGGIIFNKKEIISAYSQGKGPILVRGKADIQETKRGWEIIITEIPYQVQKANLIAQIAKLVEEGRIEKVKDIRDESDKEGLRIVIELKKGAFPKKVLNTLYKFTDLQKKFYLNMLALVDGIQPKILSLVELLQYYLDHRKEVVLRRTKYELEKAKRRAHILEGLVKCLSDIDRVISIIKRSKNREEAKKNLIKAFKLTDIQAEAILETKLATLARLEREKLKEELKQLKARIKELQAILKSPKKVKELIKKELRYLKENYGDERRTQVFEGKPTQIREEDIIPEKDVIITITRKGYVKRMDPSTYRAQHRGGKGVMGADLTDEDHVEHLVLANMHDLLLLFAESGKVFGIPVYEIPEGSRTSSGRAIVNFVEIGAEEKIQAVLPLGKKDKEQGIKYFLMVTKNGIMKKTAIDQFKRIGARGLIAINLKKDDTLRKVIKTSGNDQIILLTKKGMAIRFKEKEIREMARGASGIRGIRLSEDDEVIGMEKIMQNAKIKSKNVYLLVLSENGYGKMTQISQFKLQKRGGKGIKASKVTQKTGDLCATKILYGQEDLIIISQKGQVIRISAKSIPRQSRMTQGVRIMKLKPGDKISSLICL